MGNSQSATDTGHSSRRREPVILDGFVVDLPDAWKSLNDATKRLLIGGMSSPPTVHPGKGRANRVRPHYQALKPFELRLNFSVGNVIVSETSLLGIMCQHVCAEGYPMWFVPRDDQHANSAGVAPKDVASYQLPVFGATFGTFGKPCVFVTTSSSTAGNGPRNCRLDFEFDNAKMCLYLMDYVDGRGGSPRNFCLEIHQKSMHSVVHVDVRRESSVDIYFQLKNPPYIYERIGDDRREQRGSTVVVRKDLGLWSRRSYLPDVRGSEIGLCDVLRVRLKSGSDDVERLEKLFGNLRSRQRGSGGTDRWKFQFTHVVEELRSSESLPLFRVPSDAPFRLQYAVEVLKSVGLRCQLFELLTNFLKSDRYKVDDKEDYIYMVAEAYRHDPMYYMIDMDLVLSSKVRRSNRNVSMIDSVILTPTRVIFESPTRRQTNRIFRRYEDHADHFMKVSFRDEDITDMRPNLRNIVLHELPGKQEVDDQVMTATIVDRLQRGLRVGGRVYRVLGGSNSCLGEHVCNLFAGDGKLDAETIRKGIGELRHIRNPAEYVARLALAFTQTKPASINPQWIVGEPDVLGGRDADGKPYCFSDGIGKISINLAKYVIQQNKGGKKYSRLPCAFQIRLGGIKGVVAVDPELPGMKIVIRPSMEKFRSNFNELEVATVVDPDAHYDLYLNRQIVTLLSQQGIPDSAFFGLMNEELKRFIFALILPSEARKTISEQNPVIKEVTESVGDLTSQPFAFEIIIQMLIDKLECLKRGDKKQIPIPLDKGRNMMGVLDETGQLEYGQVYIPFTDTSGKRRVVEGPVTVSKMPALHPGDVRKLHAVDIPKLDHMCNVVVFPRKGKRPHPNEMAGSDLDGDLYFVTWRHDLILKQPNAEPMHFPKAEKLETDRPIAETDIIEQIKFLIETDIKGKVSNRHLMFADSHGIFSNECLELAHLSSQVYDAPKTGVVPLIPRELTVHLAPDFMEKDDHMSTYKSDRILGKLYRHVLLLLDLVRQLSDKWRSSLPKPEVGVRTGSLPPSTSDIDDVDLMAEKLTSVYDNAMKDISETYNISDEVHIWRMRLPSFADTKDGRVKELRRKFTDAKNKLLNQFKSFAKELAQNGRCSEKDARRILWSNCSEISREMSSSSRHMFQQGLSLMACPLYPDLSDINVLDRSALARIGLRVVNYLKAKSNSSFILECYFCLAAETDSYQSSSCTVKRQVTLLNEKPWLLAACTFLVEKIVRIQPSEQKTMAGVDCILKLVERVSIAAGFVATDDILKYDSSGILTKLYLKMASGNYIYYLMQTLSVLYKCPELGNEERNAMIGSVVVNTLWETYTTDSSAVTEQVRIGALKTLLKIAFRDVNTDDVDEVASSVEKKFTLTNQKWRREVQSRGAQWFENEVRNKFPHLEYVRVQCPGADADCTLKVVVGGPQSVVEEFQNLCRNNTESHQ